MLLQLAIGIVKGDDIFLGFKLTPEQNSVIYVSTEDDENAVKMSLEKKVKIEDKGKLSGLRFILDSDDLKNKLSKALTPKPADCVIIDTFTDISSRRA